MDVQPFPIPENEDERLCALAEYNILDTSPTEGFDRLTRLAARIFNVPIVLISLVARDRQFFKSRVGIEVCETSREVSFCAHAIAQEDILLVPDSLNDPRFSSNPLVLGEPFIRFYAGKTLVAPGGSKLGTLCLIDNKPRFDFSEEDRKSLSDLADLVMDQMESRRLEHGKNISQARFKNIAATSPDAIICLDRAGKTTFWNHSAEKMFGYSEEDLANSLSDALFPDSWREKLSAELEQLNAGISSGFEGQTIILEGVRRDGSKFPAEISLSSWKEGEESGIGAIVRDITQRRINEEQIVRLATRDSLTDLPNRSTWRKSLADTLAAKQPVTVLLLDLDNFKDVNDTLGLSAGDAVLVEVAERLKSVCSNAIITARLGADEFVVLLPGNNTPYAMQYAETVLKAISRPYEYGDMQIEMCVSVGVSMAPMHGDTSEELLGSADLALNKAKSDGKGTYVVFIPALREVALARRAFEKELRLASERNEFELHYQPQIDISTGKIIGAEALIRWNHPERGLLTPASFIDVLSQKPSASAVGEWILRTACKSAVHCVGLIPHFRVSVNLFEAQIHSGRLYSEIVSILAETGLPAHCLELELVENILLRSDKATLRLLHRLRNLGVGLAFDDYGTGFASLSLLKRFPVTRLKIDRSFIRDLETNAEDAAVVKAIIYLGESFDMEVVAEGVENEAQLDFLRQNNCTEAQGYLIGRPVPESEFQTRLGLSA